MSSNTAYKRQSSRTPAMSNSARRSTALAAGLLGLAAIVGGGQLFFSGIAHYQAQAFLKHWEQSPSQPSEQAGIVAEHAIKRAIQAYPGSNGEYLETLGYIEQWRAFGADLNDPNALQHRHAAVQALRESTQARHTWPDAWAALAFAKLTLLEFDDEFTQAMQQAQHFGPWRIGINRRIAEIGLFAHSELNLEQRAITAESMQRTVQYNAKEQAQLFELAHKTNTLAPLCNALTEQYPACTPLALPETLQHD